MKKRLVGLLLGTLGALLVACASPDRAQENVHGEVQDKEVVDLELGTDQEDIYEGFGMENPWVDSDEAGVLEATGFDMVAPLDATNIAYSYMPGTGMAQMNYTMNNAMWVYRMQPADELIDISGMYYEWSYIEDVKVAGMDGIEYSCSSEQQGEYIDEVESTRVLNWYDSDNKVVYSLSVIGTDLNGLDTCVYAENLLKQ